MCSGIIVGIIVGAFVATTVGREPVPAHPVMTPVMAGPCEDMTQDVLCVGTDDASGWFLVSHPVSGDTPRVPVPVCGPEAATRATCVIPSTDAMTYTVWLPVSG